MEDHRDREAVTGDPLQRDRDRDRDRDALGLGLSGLARALVGAGPHSEICAVEPASGACRVYPPIGRTEVLVEVGRQLAWAEVAVASGLDDVLAGDCMLVVQEVHHARRSRRHSPSGTGQRR